MNLVNGYVCNNCTDTELAKHGVDPAHKERGVQGAKGLSKDDSKVLGAKDDSKTLGATDDRDERSKKLGENRPVDSGDVGTRLNMMA